MVSINYSAREVCCKIVYYGPGLSGKTTNLQYVHAKVPGNTRGKLISLATEADRTLYFDFLPINIGTINGFAAKFQLYTVPGQVYYNATRKLVLRGVDGVVFVADSQPSKMDENIESLTNLEENLREYGYDMDDMPVVIQFNKCDLPGVLSVEDMQAQLNPKGWPCFQASATVGNGVFDTLKMIIKMVLDKAKTTKSDSPRAIRQPTPTAPPPPAAPEAPSEAGQARSALDQPVLSRQAAAPPDQPAQPASPARTANESQPVQYRPYPGSKDSQTARNGVATVAAPSDRRPADDEALAQKAMPGSDTASGSGTDPENRAPRMAPPLRRKIEKKKRGFLKRLFGMK